ncbi:MAG: dihydrofolate reductase family protein [Verrucomicrobiales bacterium]|nr:dihydrofolate reductase family protein [Verrucomicrobiales bacterium]
MTGTQPTGEPIRLPVGSRGRRPFVLINMAMTADGKIATANRALSRFGTRQDEANLYALRASVDAVMSGATTLMAEGATLGPGPQRFRQQRRLAGRPEWPLRIAVSGSCSLSPDAAVFQHGTSPVIVLTSERAPRRALHRLSRVATQVGVCGEQEVDFTRALRWLAESWQVDRLLCEGGGELNDALFRADLVDELHLTLCPWIAGGRTAPTLADGVGVSALAEARRFRLKARKRVGNELYLIYHRATSPAP